MRITLQIYSFSNTSGYHAVGKCVHCSHFKVCNKVINIREAKLGKVTFDCNDYSKKEIK